MVAELIEEKFPIIDSYISSSVKMKESHAKQVPLVYLYPKHKLSVEFERLYSELAGESLQEQAAADIVAEDVAKDALKEKKPDDNRLIPEESSKPSAPSNQISSLFLQ